MHIITLSKVANCLVPTLPAHDFGDVLRAGHGDALRHVLRLLGADLLEADAGQRVDEGAEVRGAVGLRDARHGLGEAQHGELEGELVGPVVPDVGAL